MSFPHEQLFKQSHELIEDFTCPISGLPTPDKEVSRSDLRVHPLTQCVRSIWGVSENGSALRVTQGYNIGNFVRTGDPTIIRHRELRIDLFESGVSSPVSVLHGFASLSTGAHYQGFSIEALEPHDEWPGIFKRTDALQNISERALSTMTEDSLAWFVPANVRLGHTVTRLFSETVPLEDVGVQGLALTFDSTDPRIMVAPYNFPRDITADIFVSDAKHRPTSPGPESSRQSVRAMEAMISEHAAALHGLMVQAGAIDISKL